VASRFESGVQLLEQRYTPLGRFTPGPFEGWAFLWQPAVLGFAALTSVVAGASFTNSPFKLDMANTWFFGEPVAGSGGPNVTNYIFSVVLVYGGLLLLMRVWLRLSEVMKLHVGVPLKKLWWIFGLWSIPMIVTPPLFSRDERAALEGVGELDFSAVGETVIAAGRDRSTRERVQAESLARLSKELPIAPSFLPLLFEDAANPASIRELSKRV